MGTIARYAPLAGRKQNFGPYGVRSPFENYKPPESKMPRALLQFKALPELAWFDTPYRGVPLMPMPYRPQPFINGPLPQSKFVDEDEIKKKLRKDYRTSMN